ncbi:hypothetical protein LTR17_027877, partial [Elasticomyces elasticus]
PRGAEVTRELLKAVFYPNDHTTESEHKNIANFAKALQDRFKGTISTCDDVNPQEVRAALDLTKAQLNSEGINVVSPDVFRWHMLKAATATSQFKAGPKSTNRQRTAAASPLRRRLVGLAKLAHSLFQRLDILWRRAHSGPGDVLRVAKQP